MKNFSVFIERAMVAAAIAALVLMTGITTVSVIGRYAFNSPIPDDLVMSELLMIFVVFIPLSYVQRQRAHVNVTIFTDWMPERGRAVLDTFSLLVGAVIFGVISGATFMDFYAAFSVGAYVEGPLELPESPSRFALFLGVFLLFIRLIVELVQSLAAHLRPKG